MKSKEEVLNGALNVLNSQNNPWEVIIEGDSIIAKWKWMDARFFAPNEITNEVKEYKFVVTLNDKGKWTEKDYTSSQSSNVDLGAKKISFGTSNFSGHTSGKGFAIGLGQNNDSGETGLLKFKYDTSLVKNSVRDYLTSCGYKKKGLFF